MRGAVCKTRRAVTVFVFTKISLTIKNRPAKVSRLISGVAEINPFLIDGIAEVRPLVGGAGEVSPALVGGAAEVSPALVGGAAEVSPALVGGVPGRWSRGS